MVCCDRFFILLSHNPAPRITSQNRTISQKALSLLPYERSVGFASLRNSGRSTSGIHARPLSKGGGLTARHKLLLCCFLLAICPPFLYCKLFCRQDGGIVLHPHHQLDFPHYLPPHSPKKNTKICHLSKQRILYIQFSALVKMVSGSKATML